MSPSLNCVRPEEITVELRKIAGSLGISISVSLRNSFNCNDSVTADGLRVESVLISVLPCNLIETVP